MGAKKTDRHSREQAKKRHIVLLKIISILMIILGLLYFCVNIWAFSQFQELVSNEYLVQNLRNAGFSEGGLVAMTAGLMGNATLEAILHVVAGSMGLLLLQNKVRAQACSVIAIIILTLSAVATSAKLVTLGAASVDWVSTLISFGLALLYLVAISIEAKDIARRKMEALDGESIKDKLEKINSTMAYSFIDVRPNFVLGMIAIPEEKLHELIDEEEVAEGGEYVLASFNVSDGELEYDTGDPRFESLVQNFKASLDVATDEDGSQKSGFSTMVSFLGFLMRTDAALLINWRDRLNKLEEIAAGDSDEIPDDFDQYTRDARNSLHALRRFYQQIEDMCRTLITSNMAGMTELERTRFEILASRAERFASEAEHVADFASQARILHQSTIEARQTEISTVLTVVATLCMSVSLITGWYGMNFANMPELQSDISYMIVIIICIVVVAGEFIFFKRKKWF